MKTSSVLLTFLSFTAAAAVAQSPYDELIYGELQTFRSENGLNHTELRNLINNLLTQAQNQVQRLDTQLTRMGAYTSDNIAGVTNAQTALTTSTDADHKTMLRPVADLAAARDALTGKEVFTKEIDGVFKPIGETYKDKDGNDVQRDETKYKAESLALSNLEEYYRIREAGVLNVDDLIAARAQAFEDLLSATDEMSTHRLSALIGAMNTDLLTSRLDIGNANAELTNQDRAAALQASVDAKARNEGVTANRANSRMTQAQIQEALSKLPNGGRTGPHNPDYRLPFGDTSTSAPATPPGPDITQP